MRSNISRANKVHAGDRRRRDAAARSFFLYNRLHANPTFILRPPEMVNPCRS